MRAAQLQVSAVQTGLSPQCAVSLVPAVVTRRRFLFATGWALHKWCGEPGGGAH